MPHDPDAQSLKTIFNTYFNMLFPERSMHVVYIYISVFVVQETGIQLRKQGKYISDIKG